MKLITSNRVPIPSPALAPDSAPMSGSSVPEVMVTVTGGCDVIGTVVAHDVNAGVTVVCDVVDLFLKFVVP